MITERERFQELDSKEAKLRTKVKELGARIPDLEREAAEAEAEACKKELLEEGGWKSLRAEADRKKGLSAATREEVRRAKDGVGILSRERGKLAWSIREELLATYRPRYEALLREFSAEIKAGSETLQRMAELQREANLEAGQFLAGGQLQLAAAGRGNIEFALAPDQIDEFKKQAVANGYDIQF